VGGFLLGTVVHLTLERVIYEVEGLEEKRLDRLEGVEPKLVSWPPEDRMAELLTASARDALRDHGVAVAGMVEVLAARAARVVEVVRELSWAEGEPSVIGVEVEGEVEIVRTGGPSRRVSFRADRVDRSDEGLRLVDYKAGRPPSEAAGEKYRRKHMARAVRQGRLLQAVAYHLGGRLSAPAWGEYLFLRPGVENEHRRYTVSPGDDDLVDLFHHVSGAALDAWDAGVFFPRLVEPDGSVFAGCKWCDVRQACLQEDSGARRRLARWVERAQEDRGAGAAGPMRALLAVWDLYREDSK